MTAPAELLAEAARLVVDEGLDYDGAKRKALRALQARGLKTRASALPGNEELEDAVREHIALFHADTQPAELAALRAVALTWMQRLAPFGPHLAGAVWRGTATRLSPVLLDLYCDDAKAAEIALINAGTSFDTAMRTRPGREPLSVLSLTTPCPALGEPATVHLTLHATDDLRGALKPDARGLSWRGDLAALQRLLREGAP